MISSCVSSRLDSASKLATSFLALATALADATNPPLYRDAQQQQQQQQQQAISSPSVLDVHDRIVATYFHWILFLDFLVTRPMPSRTLVMS
jgi:hypothetical protein